MNKTFSKAISLVRLPLMIGIIFIHNSYSIHYDKSYVGLGYDIYYLICSFGSVVFPSVCVPTFFFISGFLFFNGVGTFTFDQYRQKLRRRLFSLLIPFLLWNMIPILVIALKGISSGEQVVVYEVIRKFPSYFWDYKDGGNLINIFGWHVPIAFPIDGPLWFVRDLILMCIISPLVYGIIKHGKIIGVSVLVLLYIFSIWPNTIFLMLANSLCFFSLGAYFSILKKKMYNTNLALPFFLLWLASVVLVYVLHFPPVINNVMVRACNVFGVFAVINLATYIVSNYHCSWPKILLESVFFVYAAHTIYVNGFVGAYILPVLIPGDHFLLLLLKFLLSPFIVWGICLAIYFFLKKWLPSLLMYMNGGR